MVRQKLRIVLRFSKGQDSELEAYNYMVKPVTKQWTDKEQPLTLDIKVQDIERGM